MHRLTLSWPNQLTEKMQKINVSYFHNINLRHSSSTSSFMGRNFGNTIAIPEAFYHHFLLYSRDVTR